MITLHTTTRPREDAAQALETLFRTHTDDDVLFLASGGSALGMLTYIDPTCIGRNVTYSVLDERYTHEPTDSNFSQLIATPLGTQLHKRDIPHIDPRPMQGEVLLDTARRFDIALKEWHVLHPHGIVIATLGVGVDGHTSGVLPHPHNPETFEKRFLQPHHCVCGYHIDPRVNEHTDRITTTLTYMKRHIHHAIVYASGEEKRSALKAVCEGKNPLHKIPAGILRDMQDVHVYTNVTLTSE